MEETKVEIIGYVEKHCDGRWAAEVEDGELRLTVSGCRRMKDAMSLLNQITDGLKWKNVRWERV